MSFSSYKEKYSNIFLTTCGLLSVAFGNIGLINHFGLSNPGNISKSDTISYNTPPVLQTSRQQELRAKLDSINENVNNIDKQLYTLKPINSGKFSAPQEEVQKNEIPKIKEFETGKFHQASYLNIFTIFFLLFLLLFLAECTFLFNHNYKKNKPKNRLSEKNINSLDYKVSQSLALFFITLFSFCLMSKSLDLS